MNETQGAINEEAWQSPLAVTKSAGDAPPDGIDAARERFAARSRNAWKEPLNTADDVIKNG